jgi:hypothetical protein
MGEKVGISWHCFQKLFASIFFCFRPGVGGAWASLLRGCVFVFFFFLAFLHLFPGGQKSYFSYSLFLAIRASCL